MKIGKVEDEAGSLGKSLKLRWGSQSWFLRRDYRIKMTFGDQQNPGFAFSLNPTFIISSDKHGQHLFPLRQAGPLTVQARGKKKPGHSILALGRNSPQREATSASEKRAGLDSYFAHWTNLTSYLHHLRKSYSGVSFFGHSYPFPKNALISLKRFKNQIYPQRQSGGTPQTFIAKLEKREKENHFLSSTLPSQFPHPYSI